MPFAMHRNAIVAIALSTLLAGCAHIGIQNDVPACERLIPQSLLSRVPPADLPEPRQHADGHQDALPWQEGFVAQTGQLDKANDRGDGIDHIYRTCIEMHREALNKSKRGFFGRLFGR